MKKKYPTTLHYVLVLILVIGASYAFADPVFKLRPANPPNENREYAVNAGTNPQVKTGALGVGLLFVNQSAQFDKKFIQTRYFLGDDTNVFKFGSTTHKASINVSGRLGTGAYFQSDTLAGRGNNVPICTDGAGEIQFCP